MAYDSDQTVNDELTGETDGTEDGTMNEMQRLLDEQGASFKEIKRGDVLEGQIVRIDPEEILVDIGLKSEGVLSTKELPPSGYGSLSELKIGDQVLVYVMQPETNEGHAVVSIKRARLERQWRIAQEQYERGELLEAEVIDHNKGGLIVNLEGIRGFVPISQILNLKREDSADNAETQTKLQAMVGRRLQLKIIEINRNRNRLILSERLAVQEWRQRRREELLNELQVGEVRKGVVSNLANFGAFVDLGGADGLVHISQLAWSRVNHPSEVLKVGQEVEVQVLSVDKEKKKIALSIKRAEVDPWTTVEQRYVPGQLVKGTITKIAPFGAFARIEDGVEGLIHLSELPAGTTEPKQALHEGQEVTVRILRIDAERRRLGLSVRQAQEGGEAAEPEAAGAAAPSGEATAAPTATAAPAAAPAPSRRPAEPEEPQTAFAAAFRAAQEQQNREREQAVTSEPATPAASTESTTPAEPEASATSAEPAAVVAPLAPAEPVAAEEPLSVEDAAPAAEPVAADATRPDATEPEVAPSEVAPSEVAQAEVAQAETTAVADTATATATATASVDVATTPTPAEETVAPTAEVPTAEAPGAETSAVEVPVAAKSSAAPSMAEPLAAAPSMAEPIAAESGNGTTPSVTDEASDETDVEKAAQPDPATPQA
jgi:small subunit ribosomal protein S1